MRRTSSRLVFTAACVSASTSRCSGVASVARGAAGTGTPVIVWPTSSWRSRAIRCRSSSCACNRKRNDLSVYWKSLPLRPGLYKVDIVIKDVNNPDHIGRWQRSLNVPRYDDDRLASSSLILAGSMERVPTRDIGSGNFVIGDTHIVPRVPSGVAAPVTFHRAQNLNFWMQVYNLGIDEKSKQNGATIEYQILDLTTNKTILQTAGADFEDEVRTRIRLRSRKACLWQVWCPASIKSASK